MDVDSQPIYARTLIGCQCEVCGASSEALTTPADTVGVVDAHVIPGNLSPVQPVTILASYQILIVLELC